MLLSNIEIASKIIDQVIYCYENEDFRQTNLLLDALDKKDQEKCKVVKSLKNKIKKMKEDQEKIKEILEAYKLYIENGLDIQLLYAKALEMIENFKGRKNVQLS